MNNWRGPRFLQSTLACMISSFISFFLIFLLCHVSFAYHIANNRQIHTNYNFDTVSSIQSPFEVNCTISLCGGDLAPIYCHGDILSTAWRFGLQDLCPGARMRFSAKQILENFQKLKYPIEKEEFRDFCGNNFEDAPYLKNVTLPDFKIWPHFFDSIRRKDHLKLAKSLHSLWNKLSREFVRDVHLNTSFYPIVPVNNAFIVPGGKFQIFFYWDSYWILKGLYLSELVRTAKGMIQNFADIIDKHGFIPNSGSIQLSRRSQPPMFVQMVKDYFDVTKNVETLRRWIPFMDREMQWWINKRSVEIDLPSKRTAFVYLYRTETNCPRPENFLSDYYLGLNSTDPMSSWTAMASACESGWDFSSRWFDHEGERQYAKVTIRTQTIVPVDLNVYMALNMRFLADSHTLLGNHSMATWYRDKYDNLLFDINALFWNMEEGVWFDYDLHKRKQRSEFYPSNVFPLLLAEMEPQADNVYNYLERIDVFRYPGGVPSTMPVKSTEQWDFPNVWAPTQHFFIRSLLTTKHPGLQQRALDEADKFVTTVFNGLFNPQKGMPSGVWEKYDARSSEGKPGGGGEYVVQEGFGWTNGVVMDLINLISTHDVSIKSTEMNLFGEPERAGFVIVAIFFLLLLATWFASCGLYGYFWFPRQRVVQGEERSSRHLLEESDSD